MIIEFYTKNVLPILFLQLFIFIIIFIYSFNSIKKQFPKVGKSFWILLCLIIFFSAVFQPAVFQSPFYFENKIETLRTAKEFSAGSTQFFYVTNEEKIKIILSRTTYPWGSTYPFILSILFMLFGVDIIWLVILDKMMLALSIITIFYLILFLTRDKKTALLGTIFFSFIFIFIFTSLVVSQFLEIVFFFNSLSILLMFLSYKMDKIEIYMLTLLCILFTMEIIFEMIILIVAFFAGLMIYRIKHIRKIKFLKSFAIKILVSVIIFSLFSPLYFAKTASEKFYLYPPGVTSYDKPTKSLLESTLGMFNAIKVTFLEKNEYKQPLTDFSKQFIWLWTQKMLLFLSIFGVIGIIYGFIKYRKETFILSLIFVLHTFTYFVIGNGYQDVYAMRSLIPIILLSCLGIQLLRDMFSNFEKQVFVIILIFLVILLSFYSKFFLNGNNRFGYVTCEEYNLGELENLENDKNIGVITSNTFSLEKTIEFVTLKDAIMLESLIGGKFKIKLPPEFLIFYGGGEDFNQTLKEERYLKTKGRDDYLFTTIFENQTLRNKLFSMIIEEGKNNYYFEGKTRVEYPGNLSDYYIKKYLNLTKISENNCFILYKIEGSTLS